MAGKKIIGELTKGLRKLTAEDVIRKRMRKELTDTGTPASTAATPSRGAKVTEGEVPETAKYGKPRTKFRNQMQRLQYEYDGLTPSAKRAERMKGSDSEYYAVFKERGMTPIGSKKATPTEVGQKKNTDQLKEAREYYARPDVKKRRDAEDKIEKIRESYQKGSIDKDAAMAQVKPLMDIIKDFNKKNPGPYPTFELDMITKRKSGGRVSKRSDGGKVVPTPKRKPTPPVKKVSSEDAAAIKRGNRIQSYEAGAAKAMGVKGYKHGGPVGCGVAMRGYGKGPYKKK